MITTTFTAIFIASFLAFSYAVPYQVLSQSTQRCREGLPGRRLGGQTPGECSPPALSFDKNYL